MTTNEAALKLARPIPGRDGYLATPDGKIISLKRKAPAFLKTSMNRQGYRVVGLNRKTPKVAALVCAAFYGPRPEGLVVRHLDGCRTNDSKDNLRWGTLSENVRDAIKHGTHSGPANGRKSAHKIRGENHGSAKLTWPKVRDIRKRRAAGEELSAIARDYGVTFQTVSLIALGRTWIEPTPRQTEHPS